MPLVLKRYSPLGGKVVEEVEIPSLSTFAHAVQKILHQRHGQGLWDDMSIISEYWPENGVGENRKVTRFDVWQVADHIYGEIKKRDDIKFGRV